MLILFSHCHYVKSPPIDKNIVELKMILFSDGAPDADLVWEEISKLAKKDIYATVKVEFIPWRKRNRNRITIMLATRDDIDLIFSGKWARFKEFAKLGYYYPLDDLLPKYAPQTWKNIPKLAWEHSSHNGNIYLVPYNAFEIYRHGLMYRRDLARKYGFKEGKLNNIDDLESYLYQIRDDLNIYPANFNGVNRLIDFIRSEKGMRPYPQKNLLHGFYTYLDDPQNLFAMIESPGFKNWILRAKKWADRKFWTKDILLNSPTSRGDRKAFMEGKSAVASVNPYEATILYNNLMIKDLDQEYGWYDLYNRNENFLRCPLIHNGIAITKNSKNPEKALMLLEKLHNDQRYFDISTYGIRGRHWDLDKTGELVLPAGVTEKNNGYPWNAACPWGWREEKFYRLSPLKSKSVWSEIRLLYKNWQANKDKQIFDYYPDFLFDLTPVANEWKQIQVLSENYDSLVTGYVDEPMQFYREYIKKIKEAGFEKLKREKHRQWQEYLKQKTKK